MSGEPPVRIGRVWPDLFAVPAVVGATMLMLVTLPVTLPIASLIGRNDRRRLEAVASVTLCSRCGALLGPDSPASSDAAHMAVLAEVQRRNPTHRMHVARRTQARCPGCGADYVWDGKSRTLHLLADAVIARDQRHTIQQAGEHRRCAGA